MNEVTLTALKALERRGFIIHTFEDAASMEDFLVSQRTQTQRQETTRLALELGSALNDQDAQGLFSYVQERAYSMGGRVLVLDTDAVVQVDSTREPSSIMLPSGSVPFSQIFRE